MKLKIFAQKTKGKLSTRKIPPIKRLKPEESTTLH